MVAKTSKKKKTLKKSGHEPFLIFSAYSKLLNTARHHGAFQSSYRLIASSWLLATFVAIGFLLSKDNILPFEHILGVPLICSLGIIGLYLIWYEDTVIQETLLDINVVEALELEKLYPWLPQLHHRFLKLYKSTNARFVKVLFFIGCTSILFFIMTIALAIYLYDLNIILMILIVFSCLLLNAFSAYYMIYKAGKIQEFMEYLTNVDERRRTSS